MAETYQKPALTFEKQLEHLEGRGLVINDRVHALSRLSAISYYRLSAYWHPFHILLMLRYLLRTTNNGDNWCQQCNKLLEPISAQEKWRLAMGMPENWKDHPVWK